MSVSASESRERVGGLIEVGCGLQRLRERGWWRSMQEGRASPQTRDTQRLEVVRGARRRVEESGVCEEVVSARWQVSEWWEVRGTSWWEHGRTRRRGSTHCVGVVVDGDNGSLRWNWDACERRQPIAELMDVL